MHWPYAHGAHGAGLTRRYVSGAAAKQQPVVRQAEPGTPSRARARPLTPNASRRTRRVCAEGVTFLAYVGGKRD